MKNLQDVTYGENATTLIFKEKKGFDLATGFCSCRTRVRVFALGSMVLGYTVTSSALNGNDSRSAPHLLVRFAGYCIMGCRLCRGKCILYSRVMVIASRGRLHAQVCRNTFYHVCRNTCVPCMPYGHGIPYSFGICVMYPASRVVLLFPAKAHTL